MTDITIKQARDYFREGKRQYNEIMSRYTGQSPVFSTEEYLTLKKIVNLLDDAESSSDVRTEKMHWLHNGRKSVEDTLAGQIRKLRETIRKDIELSDKVMA